MVVSNTSMLSSRSSGREAAKLAFTSPRSSAERGERTMHSTASFRSLGGIVSTKAAEGRPGSSTSATLSFAMACQAATTVIGSAWDCRLSGSTVIRFGSKPRRPVTCRNSRNEPTIHVEILRRKLAGQCRSRGKLYTFSSTSSRAGHPDSKAIMSSEPHSPVYLRCTSKGRLNAAGGPGTLGPRLICRPRQTSSDIRMTRSRSLRGRPRCTREAPSRRAPDPRPHGLPERADGRDGTSSGSPKDGCGAQRPVSRNHCRGLLRESGGRAAAPSSRRPRATRATAPEEIWSRAP
ncbi:hypothetical protein DFJ74DRAFT_454903 [Hyaloraphidium curvatum]|nr:hypothetical protein DFJ74DRAFT_454903 [Hyaloraphidium curvatum]